MSSKRWSAGLATICLALAVYSCGRALPVVEQTVFSAGFVSIELDRCAEIRSAELTSMDGTRIARVVFSGGYRGRTVKIDCNWTENSSYRIHLATDAGRIEYTAVAPQSPRDEICSFQFPFGLKSRGTIVPADTEITGSLQLKNDSSPRRRYAVRVSFPQGFRIADSRDDRYRETGAGTMEFRDQVELSNRYDSKIIGITVMSPGKCTLDPGEVTVQVEEADRTIFRDAVSVRVIAPETLSGHIKTTEINFPTDAKGYRDERLIPDILHLAPLPRLLAIITGRENDDTDHRMIPFGFYAVKLRNTLEEDSALVIRSWVEDPNTGESIEAFRPHFHVNAAGEIFTFAIVPGRSTQTAIMPIYVEPSLVLPGSYRLCCTLTQFGTSTPFSANTHNFEVARQPVGPMVVTTAGTLLAVLFLPAFFVFFARIYGDYKVRWIVLAALYGAVGFVVVNIPGTFFADLFRALLEPFNFLATGFFYGVVQYALWGSLIVLVPRKGIMALVMTVRLLLTGIMLGHISAVAVIWMATHAVLAEVMLWLTGCTRKDNGTGVTLVSLVPAFVVSEGISTFFNFESAIFFFRLYYADWYIVLNCLIGGVFYTAIGTVVGLNMGKKLGMVAE